MYVFLYVYVYTGKQPEIVGEAQDFSSTFGSRPMGPAPGKVPRPAGFSARFWVAISLGKSMGK